MNEHKKNIFSNLIIDEMNTKEWTLKRFEREIKRRAGKKKELCEKDKEWMEICYSEEEYDEKDWETKLTEEQKDYLEKNNLYSLKLFNERNKHLKEETKRIQNFLIEKCLEAEQDGFHIVRASFEGIIPMKLDGFKDKSQEKIEKIINDYPSKKIFLQEKGIVIFRQPPTSEKREGNMNFDEINEIVDKVRNNNLINYDDVNLWVIEK